jgi:hypothetical protein
MAVDIELAREFMTSQARLLDRRRYEVLFGDADPESAVAALAGYANPDRGFGWALHPDLRSKSSQPVAAIHAFDVLEEIAPLTSPLAVSLCDWLDRVSLADGGLPFALPHADAAGSAPMWAGADPRQASLLITCAVCAIAHRVAVHDPAVAEHPWLARATEHCRRAIAALEQPTMAIEFRFVLQLQDAVHGKDGDSRELERLGALLPASGTMPVEGGAEGEAMRPLDFSPEPDRPLRAFLRDDVIADDLDRLVADQREEGGWDVDWAIYSPTAALEWRGDATVRALKVLKANGRLDGSR